MSNAPKILAFAGSLRKGSFNKKLLSNAVEAARAAGGEVTSIDLRDFPLPLYDGDIEEAEGLPANAKKLCELFLANDALLISAPEYNSSITGVLKNANDWVSRHPSKPPLQCFTGKVAALFAASPGALGGLRGLVTVRSILGNIGVIVLPDQFALSKANEAFDDAGQLKDPKQAGIVSKIATSLVDVARKLRAGGG